MEYVEDCKVFILVGKLGALFSIRYEKAKSLVGGPDQKLSWMQCQKLNFFLVGNEVAIKFFKCKRIRLGKIFWKSILCENQQDYMYNYVTAEIVSNIVFRRKPYI